MPREISYYIHHWLVRWLQLSMILLIMQFTVAAAYAQVRYVPVHVFNNYYETADDYCIAARIESKVVVENNFFRNLEDAHFCDDIGLGIGIRS